MGNSKINHRTKQLVSDKQTAVDWFYDKIKSHFEHDGDLLESLTFTFAIAKQKEKENITKLCKESYIQGSNDCYDIWVRGKLSNK